MGGDISLIGLSNDDPVPGDYAEIDFAQGASSGFLGARSALLIGGMLASGTATPDTTVYGPDTAIALVQESDVIALFGDGSELHRMWVRFTAVNPTTPVYCIAVSENGTAAAATGTITFATTATGAGTCRVYVADQVTSFGIATGDTPTVIAAKAVAAINGLRRCPVVASAVAGVVTLTSKQKGLRANFVRYFAQIVAPSSLGSTVTPTASTATTGGTAADSNALALAAVVATRFYYIGSAAEDSTQLGALLTQINTQALPVTGIRQRMFGASVDTLSNTIAISTALNGARAELTWLQQSDVPPCELAANMTAVYSLRESSSVPLLNFNSYGNDAVSQPTWLIPAPLSGLAPTRSQLFAALNAGVEPIGVSKGGKTYLVARCTTRFMNGSTVDYRIRPPHKVTICDFYTDDLLQKQSDQFSGKTIADDPPDNSITPDASVVTPRVMKAAIDQLTRDYGSSWLFDQSVVPTIIANTVVLRNSSPTDRLSSRIPLRPIDILNQTANLIQQVA